MTAKPITVTGHWAATCILRLSFHGSLSTLAAPPVVLFLRSFPTLPERAGGKFGGKKPLGFSTQAVVSVVCRNTPKESAWSFGKGTRGEGNDAPTTWATPADCSLMTP